MIGFGHHGDGDWRTINTVNEVFISDMMPLPTLSSLPISNIYRANQHGWCTELEFCVCDTQ